MTKRTYTLLLLLSTALACHALQPNAEDTTAIDIDEWQVMRVEASKDPFEHTNQFSINFANYADEEWCYPLPGGKVISPFGGSRRHGGTDIKTKAGDTIRAAFPGEVILSGPYYAYGNFIVLRHANGLETAYSHNVRNLVKKGAWVHAGQPIALVGRTGRATTEHLHFETRVRGKAFDSSKIYDHHLHSIKREVMVFTKQTNGQLHITTAGK
ncbi:MAG: M23 family metallopeptidase [Bacteroidaceae bacterium]